MTRKRRRRRREKTSSSRGELTGFRLQAVLKRKAMQEGRLPPTVSKDVTEMLGEVAELDAYVKSLEGNDILVGETWYTFVEAPVNPYAEEQTSGDGDGAFSTGPPPRRSD